MAITITIILILINLIMIVINYHCHQNYNEDFGIATKDVKVWWEIGGKSLVEDPERLSSIQTGP